MAKKKNKRQKSEFPIFEGVEKKINLSLEREVSTPIKIGLNYGEILQLINTAFLTDQNITPMSLLSRVITDLEQKIFGNNWEGCSGFTEDGRRMYDGVTLNNGEKYDVVEVDFYCGKYRTYTYNDNPTQGEWINV